MDSRNTKKWKYNESTVPEKFITLPRAPAGKSIRIHLQPISERLIEGVFQRTDTLLILKLRSLIRAVVNTL